MDNAIDEGQSIESIELDMADLTEATKLSCAMLFKSVIRQHIWKFRGLFVLWILAMIVNIYFLAKNVKALNGLVDDYTLNLIYNGYFFIALFFVMFIIYAMIKQKMLFHYFYKSSFTNEPSQFYADKNHFKFSYCAAKMKTDVSWDVVSEIIETPQGHIVFNLNNRSVFALPEQAFIDKQHKEQTLQQLQNWQNHYKS